MQALWELGDSYKPALGRLLEGMDRAGARQALDLCSGGGGPWPRLVREPALRGARQVAVRLTDKYPNQAAFEQAGARSQLPQHEAEPVDATRIPERLGGFRAILSSFPHFGPGLDREMLADAVEQRRGAGVFEVARGDPRTLLGPRWVPAVAWLTAPRICRFRWSRPLWTYLIPLVPFVLFYDGVVSCLRAYSEEELAELARPLATGDYEWHIGDVRSGLLPVSYLIGCPAGRD